MKWHRLPALALSALLPFAPLLRGLVAEAAGVAAPVGGGVALARGRGGGERGFSYRVRRDGADDFPGRRFRGQP